MRMCSRVLVWWHVCLQMLLEPAQVSFDLLNTSAAVLAQVRSMLAQLVNAECATSTDLQPHSTAQQSAAQQRWPVSSDGL